MAKSMTGFGAGKPSGERYAVETEVRSLNNRYLKVRVHTPGVISILEAEIENFIRGKLSRGAVDVWIKVTDIAPADAFGLDMDIVRRYRDFAATLAEEMGIEGGLTLSDYLSLPGVISTVGEQSGMVEVLRPLVIKSLEDAMSDLERMRLEEGRLLAEDIAKRASIIAEKAALISKRSPEVVKSYRDRLLSRVKELLAGSGVEIAEADLLKEISVFAERSDISEELARIESHIKQLTSTLESGAEMGRKLEFVAQELQREVNTIGSKANDAGISRLVVDAKGEVDKIREQAANLE